MAHLMRLLLASRIMPRTTLDLDASVLRELKARGRTERKSLGTVASELLAVALTRDQRAGARFEFRWTTGKLGTPLVDLEDKDALHRVLDGRQ